MAWLNAWQFILQASRVHDRFETVEFDLSWLFGDDGYPLKSWLMTPTENFRFPEERNTMMLIKKFAYLKGILVSWSRVFELSIVREDCCVTSVQSVQNYCYILHASQSLLVQRHSFTWFFTKRASAFSGRWWNSKFSFKCWRPTATTKTCSNIF